MRRGLTGAFLMALGESYPVAEVQPIRCMVALGDSERVKLDAATTGTASDAVRADAAAKDGYDTVTTTVPDEAPATVDSTLPATAAMSFCRSTVLCSLCALTPATFPPWPRKSFCRPTLALRWPRSSTSWLTVSGDRGLLSRARTGLGHSLQTRKVLSRSPPPCPS